MSLLVHNVAAYGAVGNGITDDRAAIQAAIDAAKIGADGSNVVVFEAKNYRIAGPLHVDLTNNQSVELRGLNPSVNAADTSQAQGTRITFDSSFVNATAIHVQGIGASVNRATFIASNLWFGVVSVGQAAGQTAIQLGDENKFWEPYSKIILDNVQCWKFSGAAFRVINTHRVAMSKCIAYTPGDGGGAVGLHILATNGSFCGGVLVDTCEFTAGAADNTTERAVKIEATGIGSVCAGNMFDNTVLYYGQVGMEVKANNGGNVADLFLTNTQIDGYQPNGDASPNLDYGLYIHADSNPNTVITDVSISNSYFVGYNLHGIYVEGAANSPIKNCSFIGNQIKWNDSHGAKFENVWGFNVLGNTFNNNGTTAGAGGEANIYLSACQYFSVANNVGYNVNGSTTNAYGVYLPANYSDQFSIVNNSMTAGYANVGDYSLGSNKTIFGNYS